MSSPKPQPDILGARADEFLAHIYRLDRSDIQAASFEVYDGMDRMLCEGSFGLCDEILARADVGRLSTAVMRSFLTITWAASMDLEERDGFFARVARAMAAIRGPEVTKRLLARLS